MPRDELDAWFARADDVLHSWQDSPDAMRAGTAAPDLDPELPYIPDGRDVSFPLRRTSVPRTGPLTRLRRLLARPPGRSGRHG